MRAVPSLTAAALVAAVLAAPAAVDEPAVAAERAAAVARDAVRRDVPVVAAVRRDGHLVLESHSVDTLAEAERVVDRLADDDRVVSFDAPSRVQVEDWDPVVLEGGPAGVDTTNDPYRRQQWNLDVLGAEAAWTRPARPVTVAVVDTGVRAQHEDLAGRVLPGVDALDNGRTLRGDGRTDVYGHGTHVAGIIAATARNGRGVAGVAQNVRILPVKALNDEGYGWTSDLAAGIVYAVDHGAEIINMSVGQPDPDTTLHAAVRYATEHGVPVVASAGNKGGSAARPAPANYPGSFPEAISVASTAPGDQPSEFSSVTADVDLAAPGTAIYSTFNTSGHAYAILDGTSMAAPAVAGALAVLVGGGATAERAYAALRATAVDLRTPGRDPYVGDGRIDLAGAADRLFGPSASAQPSASVQLTAAASRTYVAGSRVTVQASVTSLSSRRALAGRPLTLTTDDGVRRTARTDASGRASFRLRLEGRTTVRVAAPGTANAATAAVTFGTVRPRVGVSVRRYAGRTRAGYRRVTVSVRGAGRQTVRVKALVDGRWRTVATVRVGVRPTVRRITTRVRVGSERTRFRVVVGGPRTVSRTVAARG